MHVIFSSTDKIEIDNCIYIVDFVTPLKKRRLARESMSQEQPLTPTPSTPSPSVLQPGAGGELGLTAVPGSPQAELEEMQNKNGIKPLLPHTPVTPEDKNDQVSLPNPASYLLI